MNKWIYLLCVFFSSLCFAKLTVVTENFPPAQYLDHNNQLTGHVYERVRKVLDNSSLDYNITVHSWSTAYNTAIRDPQTCIFSISRSKRREDKLVWIAKLSDLNTYLYSLNSKAITLDNLEQAKQYRIAVLKDNYSHHYLLSQGFEVGKNLLLIDSFDNIFNIIRSRKNSIDLVILPEQRVEYEHSRSGIKDDLKAVLKLQVTQPALYFACHKQLDAATKEELTRVFSESN
ncbi:MAG: transporter substrate-binding domain-containing protein [Pseudoalteromonas sp.]|uniref:transporter substrate-binding domain-containing protein n=1 Tax=unclassified Pseudoalteromonas TaxID=194690 RepID=UPI000C077408|nr:MULTISPECIES: transporter substrate-binding domain-containing protein [unclassified Pseudoalteromonas]MDP2635109.1 transporter substrate-binding domain-containing protein [Pseudoalteromonas sp. 1_MG-2023]PHN91470.1 amino acid ABC transporter substrate-binding protein [Pseudoalteromonas sp. 3D05]TGE85234.1 amino acid ABC transporter substrate-binding protein [Pseudoalteromonas sp. KS88]